MINLFIITLFTLQQVTLIWNSKILEYKNYVGNSTNFPIQNPKTYQHKIFSNVFSINKDILIDTNFIEVTGETFDLLFRKFIEEHWNYHKIIKDTTLYNSIINKRIHQIKIFYQGKIIIDSNYNSQIFLLIDNAPELRMHEYNQLLVNINNNRLLSFILISSNFQSIEATSIYETTRISKNLFLYKELTSSSDVIDSKPKSLYHIKFMFDKNGYIKIINK